MSYAIGNTTLVNRTVSLPKRVVEDLTNLKPLPLPETGTGGGSGSDNGAGRDNKTAMIVGALLVAGLAVFALRRR